MGKNLDYDLKYSSLIHVCAYFRNARMYSVEDSVEDLNPKGPLDFKYLIEAFPEGFSKFRRGSEDLIEGSPITQVLRGLSNPRT